MPDPIGATTSSPGLALGEHEAGYRAAVERARDEHWAERLFARDTTLWSTDPRVQAAIAERLGWLDAPAHFTTRSRALEGFGEGIRDAGFTTAIVAGMGGSSLAPEVLVRTFGSGRRLARPARPRLDRPGGGRRDRRRPGPARDAVHRRQQVRHDDRAARLPGRRLGPDRVRPSGAAHAPRQRARRRADGRDHRPGQERRGDPPSRRPPRDCSSTRPTSAAATPR